MEIKDKLNPDDKNNIIKNKEENISDIKIENQKNINNNKKEEERIENLTESNIIVGEKINKYYNSFYASKKNVASSGRIKIYKNRYRSPDINKLKQNEKNKLLLNVVYQKNNSYREELSFNEKDNEYSLNPINEQFFNDQNYLTDRESRNNNNPYVNPQYNHLSLNNYNIPHSKQIIYTNTYDKTKILDNKKINYMNSINNVNSFKVLRKSNSYSSLYFDNSNEIDKFEKLRNEGRYEIIKIRFPRQQIVNNNQIEYIPGKFEVINPNKDLMVNQFVENKNYERNNNNKQIINQENIIINNGFVNMNNNYYVNNNVKNEKEEINENHKDKIIYNSQKILRENIIIGNFNKDNNYIKNNDEIINKHVMENFHDNKSLDSERYDNNFNKMDYKNIVYNNLNDNLFNQRLNKYNIVNNNINKNLNDNININANNVNNVNNDINNNLDNKLNNRINIISNNDKYMNINKFTGNFKNQINYNNKYIPAFKDNNLIPIQNNEIRMKNDNFHFPSINDLDQLSNKDNLLYSDNKINNSINIYNKDNPKIIPINKNIKNNIYNHFYNLNNNPQLFHPHFHSNIPTKFFSYLQIQCPVQMLVKKSKINKLARHKLITYYPPKVQIEIRPCFIYQDNSSQNRIIPMPLLKNRNPYLFDRIQFPNQITAQNFIINNNNEYMNKRISHNKIKRRRPVFKIPPCKKASVSQGKSLNFIHKYYDENFILEEDDEEENKDKLINSERKKKIKNGKKIESNYFSDNEENRLKKKMDLAQTENDKININIFNMKNDNKSKEYKIELKIDNKKEIQKKNESNLDETKTKINKIIGNIHLLKNSIENNMNSNNSKKIENYNESYNENNLRGNNKKSKINKKEINIRKNNNQKISKSIEDKNDDIKIDKNTYINNIVLKTDGEKKDEKKKIEKIAKKDNIILLDLKKSKLEKMKLEKESSIDINSNNINNIRKIMNNKKIKKRFNSITNTNKVYNSNIIEKKEKLNIGNNNRNKVFNTVNSKKKSLKIINCDKAKKKFILKSNSLHVKKIGEVKIEKKLVPRMNQSNYSFISSYKKLMNKNKNNDKSNKFNNDLTNKTNDRPRNIVVKIDLTKI